MCELIDFDQKHNIRTTNFDQNNNFRTMDFCWQMTGTTRPNRQVRTTNFCLNFDDPVRVFLVVYKDNNNCKAPIIMILMSLCLHDEFISIQKISYTDYHFSL